MIPALTRQRRGFVMNCKRSKAKSLKASLSLATIMLASLAVSGCDEPDKFRPQPISVSASDQAPLNKRAPGASEASLSSDPVIARKAKANDDALLERWVDDVEAAWGRMCRSMAAQGVVMPLACPAAKD